MRSTRLQAVTASVAGALLLIVMGILLMRSMPGAGSPALDESARLAACRKETLELTKPEKVDVQLLQQVSAFCYTQVRGEDLLGDFNVRRTNYLRQQFQGMVFLWMLVAITISGVIMAAVQLAAAYKLAVSGRGAFDQGGEITIEEKRLSLKSSVTGLLILTVSFAFFMVFVIWVYPLTEKQISPEGTVSTPQSPQMTLSPGGLGPPPATPAPSAGAPK